MRIGTDLDGVIARQVNPDGLEKKLKNGEYPIDELEDAWRDAEYTNDPIAKISNLIITARPERSRLLTRKWLHRNGIRLPLIMLPEERIVGKFTTRKISKWKAEEINHLGLDIYFEDSQEHLDYLRENTEAVIAEVKKEKY